MSTIRWWQRELRRKMRRCGGGKSHRERTPGTWQCKRLRNTNCNAINRKGDSPETLFPKPSAYVQLQLTAREKKNKNQGFLNHIKILEIKYANNAGEMTWKRSHGPKADTENLRKEIKNQRECSHRCFQLRASLDSGVKEVPDSTF